MLLDSHEKEFDHLFDEDRIKCFDADEWNFCDRHETKVYSYYTTMGHGQIHTLKIKEVCAAHVYVNNHVVFFCL